MSAIFYHDEAQRILATKALKAEAARRGSVVHTRLLALDRFYRAEDYHQKYYLRRRADLMKTFNAVFRKPIDFADATISMRVNAYLAGHGSLETVRRELEKHGLSESDAARIRAMLAQVESKRKQR
jgi:peptide-methionine (S)-S-oxide reductase